MRLIGCKSPGSLEKVAKKQNDKNNLRASEQSTDSVYYGFQTEFRSSDFLCGLNRWIVISLANIRNIGEGIYWAKPKNIGEVMD